ncbi:Mur ligase family protein [Patescibacteria group bacterium]|nr:Mur ligase family protein [Patescibacteria group bacterium]
MAVKEFIDSLHSKKIHIVGVTGSEGSGILRFLQKNEVRNITAHDFSTFETLEKSYKLWHKGVPKDERKRMFSQFMSDLNLVTGRFGKDYLSDILEADVIFVPQSWRLYSQENAPLWQAIKKGIPFFSLTRLYLELSQATVIGVTGTVGKGSVVNLIVNLLQSVGKSVYFAGNDTWMTQIAEKLDGMTNKDYLVLEISHRQLQDGISRCPHVAVITNLFPNHQDEVGWGKYKQLKLSLLSRQTENDYVVLNYDNLELRNITDQIKSQILYYSVKSIDKNNLSIQNMFHILKNINSDQYFENILAASTVANLLNIPNEEILESLEGIQSLPARLQLIDTVSGIKIYDDIKSTTPWATMAALERITNGIFLIIGGNTKGIDYLTFFEKIKNMKGNIKKIYALPSQLSDFLKNKGLEDDYLIIDNNLESALKDCFLQSQNGDSILVSPAAAFFYTKFIKGKKSLRDIVISLPPKGRVAEARG